MAPAPDYVENHTLFMLTHCTGGRYSLWRSINDGAIWERTYSSALANVTALDKVKLPPQYSNDHQVVFISGSSGNPALFKSTDNGQTFTYHETSNPNTGASFSLDTWTPVDDNSLLIGSFDGSNGLVYHTTNAGAWYITATTAGSQSLNSIARSPDYSQDETILVGNSNGWIYWSRDDGNSFEPLPPDATTPPLTGNISIAFDRKFANNNTVYAASDSQGGGIYRYIIGTSSDWESIDGTLPSNATVGELKISDDGALYSTNFKADGGMERCLNPTYPLGPTFETITTKLTSGATLTGLWVQNDRLWSIDTTNNRIMSYTDSLARQVSLNSPEEKTPSIGNIVNYTVRNVGLDWEVQKGTNRYRWQVDSDTDFLNLPTGFEGESRATSANLPALEMATTYYWRVRAISPVLSPWSPTWSFTTCLGSETMAPKLISPEGGTNSAILRPLFQWSAIDWGHHYELLLSTDPTFTNPTIVKMGEYALPSTAWQCDVDLKHEMTYYWKVRATGSSSYSAWSAVGAFITESLPPPTTSPTPSTASPKIDRIAPLSIQSATPSAIPSLPPPPPSTPQPTFPHWADWLIYLGSALLLTMVAMVITLVILALKIGKL
ncbi:WD40/YVTN/BNR-like repeat-containing protein [Bacteroidota bacterium]